MENLTAEDIEVQKAIEAPQVAEAAPTPTPEPTPAPAPGYDLEPKKGRGRPKGSTRQPGTPGEPVKMRHKTATIEDIRGQVNANAQRIMAENPGTTPQQAVATAAITTPGTPDVANLIDGYIVLLILDAICPQTIKFLFKKKFEGIPADAISLTETQKKSLEPLADQIAKYLVGYVNPLYAFLMVSGLMYYQNANNVLSRRK
jgi:hypothetical protein